MAPTAHSKFGASGASRFIACPGSIQLADRMEQIRGQPAGSNSSVFAAEGTAAHALLEDVLQGKLATTQLALGSGWMVDGYGGGVDQEFCDAVAVAVAEVEKRRAQYGAHTEWVEKRITLDKLWTGQGQTPPADLFGTADWVRLAADSASRRVLVTVLDLKFGKGVAVEVRDNPQLLYYALGAMLDIDAMGYAQQIGGYGLDVEVVIVQPRAAHPEGPVRVAHYAGLDVLAWGDDVLKPAVEKALMPDAPLATGTHCRWCSALSICPAMRQTALDTAKREFGPLPAEAVDLTGRELGELLSKGEALEAWLQSLKDEARGRLDNGEPVPGWRIVERKGKHTWSLPDHDVPTALARAIGTMPAENTIGAQVKVRTPTEVQKLLTPERWAVVEKAGLVVEGKPSRVLVKDTDPRSASRRDPRADFDAITDDHLS